MLFFLIAAGRSDNRPLEKEKLTNAGQFTLSGQKPKIAIGDLEVELAPEWAWTIRGASYKGMPMITPTGYNGSVINAWTDPQGVTHKWIGTGHGGEIIKEIILKVDNRDYPLTREGQICRPDNFSVRGKSFALAKKSIIGPYACDILLEFAGDRIDETARFHRVADEAALSLFYVFMHCLSNDTDQWITEVDGKILKGSFKDDNSFTLKKDIRWAGIYSSKTGSGLAYVYPEIYKGARNCNQFWNRPRDNKLYFDAQADKKEKDFTFSVSLVFFQSPEKEWQKKTESILSERFKIRAALSENAAANEKAR